MRCGQCGAELDEGAKFCKSCGARVGSVKTVEGTMVEVGEKTVDVTKKGLKGAARLTGKALSKVGSATKKAGEKIKEKGES